MKSGFIYLWYDKKNKKFYLGSHLGLSNDGYIASNYRLKCAFKNHPETFKRRILESFDYISPKELIQREQKWLNLIKPHELNNKYYNEKNVASGGNIIHYLSLEKRRNHALKSGTAAKKYWDNITEDEYKNRVRNAFGGNIFSREYLKERNKKLCSKTANITHPNGKFEQIHNVAEFCRNNDLDYGAFKKVLGGKRKTHKGYGGHYI